MPMQIGVIPPGPPMPMNQRQWMPPAAVASAGSAPYAGAQPAALGNAGMALLGQLKGAKPAPPAPAPPKQPMTLQQVQDAQAQAQAQSSNKQSADAIWKMLGGNK